MNRFKIVLGYLCNFLLAILVFLLVFCLIIKNNIYNKDKLFTVLENNNYYENVSKVILDEMENYMVSSGLPESILNDIYSKDDIRRDVNNYIDNLFIGKFVQFNDEELVKKINFNIDNYLNEHNLKINDELALNMFVKDLVKIYDNNINLYNLVNNYIPLFAKVNKILNIAIYIIIAAIVILAISLFILKNKYIGSSLSASGIILLFIKLLILDPLNIKSVLIISTEFSNIMTVIYKNIESNIIIIGIILFIIGLLVSFGMSIKRNIGLKKQ